MLVAPSVWGVGVGGGWRVRLINRGNPPVDNSAAVAGGGGGGVYY